MPYRLNLQGARRDTCDRLVGLGALDVDASDDGGIASILPDAIVPEQVVRTLGAREFSVTPAVDRDAGSVWLLRSEPTSIGRLRIVPAEGGGAAMPGTLQLIDAAAFGTGRHPTTFLCLDALLAELEIAVPAAVLDVGTGSGVLALAALILGIPSATGIDLDAEAMRTASANARLNALAPRLQLAQGGPQAVRGTWPLVLANILAGPLMEMAPDLVRRVGHHGGLVLSGVPVGVEEEVKGVYRRLGMHLLRTTRRQGWAALVLRASW